MTSYHYLAFPEFIVQNQTFYAILVNQLSQWVTTGLHLEGSFGGIRFPHVMGFDYLALKLITKNNFQEIGSGPRGFMLLSVL
jgi:hypothetical protein